MKKLILILSGLMMSLSLMAQNDEISAIELDNAELFTRGYYIEDGKTLVELNFDVVRTTQGKWVIFKTDDRIEITALPELLKGAKLYLHGGRYEVFRINKILTILDEGSYSVAKGKSKRNLEKKLNALRYVHQLEGLKLSKTNK